MYKAVRRQQFSLDQEQYQMYSLLKYTILHMIKNSKCSEVIQRACAILPNYVMQLQLIKRHSYLTSGHV